MPRIPPRTPPGTPTSTPTDGTAGTSAPTPAAPAGSASAGASGLDAATDASATPDSGGGVLGGGNVSGGGGIAARLAASRPSIDGASLFAIDRTKVPDAVGLPDVLRQLAQHPQAAQHVQRLIGVVQQQTGVTLSDAEVQAVLAKPERLLDVMQFTPKQLSDGMLAMHAQYAARGVDAGQTRKHALPDAVDVAKLSSYDVPLSQDEPKEIVPGLLRGGHPSELSEAEQRNRIATAEVFDRLADNAADDPPSRFRVSYNGSEFTRLDTFLSALRESGHEVTVRVDHRVANFSSLMTKAPNGDLLDVPAPVMVRTGKRDADGNEAVLPSVHSEMIIEIEGADVNTELKWYQGVPNTGFFPVGLHRTPTWCGGRTSDTFTGDQAAKAVELAGLLSDVIKTTADDLNLRSSGYGVTGVCNDSVAVIQHALTGRATSYPLTMNDDPLIGELKRRMSDTDRRDDPEYRLLQASIDALPRDADPNPTAHARALASSAYEIGEAPFPSTEQALAILSAD